MKFDNGVEFSRGFDNEPKEPTECTCGCKELIKVDVQHDMGFESEYTLKCSKCEKVLSEYCYGHIRLIESNGCK